MEKSDKYNKTELKFKFSNLPLTKNFMEVHLKNYKKFSFKQITNQDSQTLLVVFFHHTYSWN